MSNNFTCIVNLGAKPEEIVIGERRLMKLRCAEKAGSKNAETRWFSALVSGPDVATAERLEKGDTLAVTGELVSKAYTPKSGPNKGKKQIEDEIPYAKILRVIKSPSFFSEAPADAPEEPAFSPEADVPDLDGL
jgi:single-stranded DNA-binding protein